MNSLSVEIENLCELQLQTLIFSTGGSKPAVIFQGIIEAQTYIKKNLGYTFAQITISISRNQRKIVHWEVNLDQIHLNGNTFMINQHTQITQFKRNFDDCTIKLQIKKSSKSCKEIFSEERQNEKIFQKTIVKIANNNLKKIYKNSINKLREQQQKQEANKKSRNQMKKALLEQKSVENVIKNIKQRGQKAYQSRLAKLNRQKQYNQKTRNRNLSIDQSYLMTKSLGEKFLKQKQKQAFRLSNLSFINRSQLLAGLEKAVSSKHHSRQVSKNFSIAEVNENLQYLESDQKQSQKIIIKQQFFGFKPQKKPTIFSQSLHQQKNRSIFGIELKKKALKKKFWNGPRKQWELPDKKKLARGYITKLKYFRQMSQLQFLQGCEYSSYFSNLFAPPSAIPYKKNIYKLHY